MTETWSITAITDIPCMLGEGAFWHPQAHVLCWFDILNKRLFCRDADGLRQHDLPEMASAAGWIDRDHLLVATERRLVSFDLRIGAILETLAPLGADDPANRCNDGRADPRGGFWISTMGKQAEPGHGVIWRFWRGAVRPLFTGLTIPNAICFAPDGSFARFTDTPTGRIMQVALDADGWPAQDPEVWRDLSPEGLNPDGAVIDAAGNMWIAQWGAGRVAAYDPSGRFLRAMAFPAAHTSCPAFGGPARDRLFCTTARQGMSPADIAAHPQSGLTFEARAAGFRGQAEHRVIL